ncbi:helix-turn-helix transcriptional regulator [Myxacorys almedinensis]|uniref:Helix-turn-helix domain-containing protein n=1 Tax=Myxacorys almedinensis A TaxID=2690445 RepID=A0A8J8CKE4_9CYAN|nr:AraC family transcriptional regulator [Myxacorys almedinensis]NDJ18531.1 helix-turn-helix domain-containing protein [Myxacorys almedinensis A]
MTITISERDWAEWEEERSHLLEYPDPDDECDVLMPQPTWLAQGYTREVTLREGLFVRVEDYQMRDRCEQSWSGGEEEVRFHCHLSGDHQDFSTEVGNLEYALYGSGDYPKQTMTCSGQLPILEVTVEMSPDVLINFAGDRGALPLELQHLIGASIQPSYARVGVLSPTMQGVLWQIIRCPYRGLMKRMYLESKALEIAALMLEQEQEVQQGRRVLIHLKSDEVDRIHRARKILLQNLEAPPSLMELARQVGLNDSALKRGFRQVFGKPVFGYLLDYRMEQAQQLLMSGDLKVGEVMQQVGFRNRQYFAEAFRKKFGVNPKDYLKGNLRNTR